MTPRVCEGSHFSSIESLQVHWNYERVGMDGDKCILQFLGVRPFLSDKYNLTQHPLYKETGEYADRNKLDIQQFVHQTMKVRSGEAFDVIKI